MKTKQNKNNDQDESIKTVNQDEPVETSEPEVQNKPQNSDETEFPYEEEKLIIHSE